MPRTPGNSTGPLNPDQAQSIQQWTRTYAQNRSLGVVVNLCIFVVLSSLIGGASMLTAYGFVKAKTGLLVLGAAADLLSVVALIWLSVPRWGGRWQQRLAARLYAKEGQVTLPESGKVRRSKTDIIVAITFGTCVIATVQAGFWINIPIKYMQPISAVYCVPFMVYIGCRIRPAGGWAMMLWPGLFALHAVLIVAGAPIVWTGPWEGLNMLIPVAGYGILAGLVGHLYSRVALHRLRSLAGAGDETAAASSETNGHE